MVIVWEKSSFFDRKRLGGKSYWEWMQVCIVPFAIAMFTIVFSVVQSCSQRQTENQRAQDTALQAYLNQMSHLLLEKDLRPSEGDSEVRTLARARTLTVLEGLDPSRKTTVIQFLLEAGLVQRVEGSAPIIGLGQNAVVDLNGVRGADLSGVDLSNADLYGAELTGVDLNDADLYGADLSAAEVDYADLSDANLNNADLSGVDLGSADLSGANLQFANLRGAYEHNSDGSRRMVTNEKLEEQAASLEGATMPDGSKHP